MRINEILTELRGIKGDVAQLEPDAGHDSWEKLLAQHGFQPIGRGYHGQVYSNPKLSYVLKVFTNQDTAYQDWVRDCQGPLLGNPYVPVFRGKIVRLNSDAMATRMELLQPASLKQLDLARQIQSMLLTSKREQRDWTTTPLAKQMDDNLFEAIGYIQATAVRKKYMLDLRGANVMQRAGQLVIIDPLA